jgi:hypothetical protein
MQVTVGGPVGVKASAEIGDTPVEVEVQGQVADCQSVVEES